MKKIIYTSIAALAILFSACKKDNNNTPDNSTAGNYQPVAVGSKWSYRNESQPLGGEGQAEVDTTHNTMTGTSKVFGDKTFHLVSSVTGGETLESYFGYKDHIYYTRSVMGGMEGDIEIPYLDENAAAGTTWNIPVQVEDAQAQLVGTVVEKGISKTILGKTYTGVIHSKIELQTKVAGQQASIMAMDFYVAKNIGVIGIYTSYMGSELSKTELISYEGK